MMMHETFPFALASLLGVFLVVAGLLAASGSAWLYRGLHRAWPLLLLAAVYAVAFLVMPPPPLQIVLKGTGLTIWDALRYGALGGGLVFIARDYFRALCELHEGRKERDVLQQSVAALRLKVQTYEAAA